MACPRCGDVKHAQENCGKNTSPLSNLWPKFATNDEKEKAEAAWVRDLFDCYSFRDIPVTSRPSQQIIPKSTELNARNEKEVDPQNKKDAFNKELQQMRDEKAKKPSHEQQVYYHSIRPGFTQTLKDDRLLTNHIRIFQQCQCWKYEIKNLPNNATRQKKKVLIETMIKRMAFLNQNRGIFTHDSNGTIISTTEGLLKLAKDHPEPHVKLTIDQNGSILRAETIIPSARSGPNGELGMVPIAIEVPAAAHVVTTNFRNVFMGTVLERSAGIDEVVRALNMLIAKAASNVTDTNCRTFQMGANKFFLCSGYESLPNNPGFKGKGILEKNILDIHHGFFLTVKTGMGNGLLNINTTTSAFYHPQSVYDYLDQVKSKQEIFGMDQHGLKGLRVYIKYERGQEQEDGIRRKDLSVNRPERRVRTIHRVGPLSVRDQTFSLKKKGEDKTENTTLEKYLKDSKYL
jgi:eukaryotic translation initiation factor 2C